MFSPGIHNPRRSLYGCVAVTLVAWAFVAWGALEMHAAGEETLGSGLKIGLALLPAILAPAASYNFWHAVRVLAAIRRGENEIARWTVTAAELAEFAIRDNGRNALGGENLNVWTPPRAPPPAGLDIIFATDGVLVGDTYFALVTTGMFKISSVRMLADSPPAIAFRTVTTWANRFHIRTSVDALRIPVSRAANAAAARVVEHYRQVEARGIIVNRGLHRALIRLGLIGAPICFAVAAAGFVMKATGTYDDSRDIAGLLIVVGILFGAAALIVSLAAWRLGRPQLRKP